MGSNWKNQNVTYIAKVNIALWNLLFIYYVYWITMFEVFLAQWSFSFSCSAPSLFLFSLSFPLSFSKYIGKVPKHLLPLSSIQGRRQPPSCPTWSFTQPRVRSRHCSLQLIPSCSFHSPLFVVWPSKRGLLVLSMFYKQILSLNYHIYISGKATQS